MRERGADGLGLLRDNTSILSFLRGRKGRRGGRGKDIPEQQTSTPIEAPIKRAPRAVHPSILPSLHAFRPFHSPTPRVGCA
jgi:hypothetical protein